MKNKHTLRFGLLSLALLLLLTLSLMVGCVSEDDSPAGDGTDTSDTTAADTTGEIESTLADLPAADALNQIIANIEADTSESDNGKIDLDMTMGITVDMNGMQSTTTLPIKLTVAIADENMQINGSLLGETLDMTYVDGMLYMTSYGETVKCAMTPEEFAEVMGFMMGDSEAEADTDGSSILDIPELEGMKTADIFASVTSEVDPTNGDLLITAKGINESLSSTLAPLLQPMLESMGLVGGELDENGELITDPAAILAEVVGILRTMNEETTSVTFVADKTGKLLSVSMDVTMTVEQDYEGSSMISILNLKGSFAVTEGNVTVTAPADADSYPEEDWHTVFGMETAEMLELIPDETGVITLSDDLDLRYRQLSYIDAHYEEFLKEQTFKATGIFEPGESYEDGSVDAYLYLLDDAGEADFFSMISFSMNAGQAAALAGQLPQTATRVTVTYYVDLDVIDEFEYTVYRIVSIEK